MTRVLHLVENVPVPSDTRVWPEALTLSRRGCEVVVISPQGRGRDEACEERIDGIAIHRYRPRPASGGVVSYLLEYAWATWKISTLAWRLSRAAAPDVVHVANPPDLLLLAALPLRLRGSRFIFDQHDLVPEFVLSRFGVRRRALVRAARVVEWIAYRLADVVITTNESYRLVALARGRKPPEDVFVVRNGPDLSTFRPVAPDASLKCGCRHLLAYVGVMGQQDGMELALRSLASLRTRRDDWRAVFVGDGDMKPEAERLARELGLGDVVEFTGFLRRERIVPILSAADVCLAPEPKTPVNDASTLVKIGEYMAMGRPIVAYDLTESRVTAQDAALYAAPDDPDDFARCIERLLGDSALRQAMGERGRRRAETVLAWPHSEPHLLAAYRRALEGAR